MLEQRLDPVSGARRLSDGSLVPYHDRAAIERERRDPLVWLRDAVEAALSEFPRAETNEAEELVVEIDRLLDLPGDSYYDGKEPE